MNYKAEHKREKSTVYNIKYNMEYNIENNGIRKTNKEKRNITWNKNKDVIGTLHYLNGDLPVTKNKSKYSNDDDDNRDEHSANDSPGVWNKTVLHHRCN